MADSSTHMPAVIRENHQRFLNFLRARVESVDAAEGIHVVKTAEIENRSVKDLAAKEQRRA